jgi:hypothetical protein
MRILQKTAIMTSLSALLLIIVLLAAACTGVPAPAATPPAQPPVSTTGNQASSGTITIHGTVSDLHRMNCPCFTLVTGTGNVTVWYDLMIGPDGTRLPAVAIDHLADGMEIQITGIPQAGEKFFASTISTTRP